MAKMQKWVQVTIRIPVDVEQDDVGLVYVTSPFIPGLLVAEKSERQALASLVEPIEALACASAIK